MILVAGSTDLLNYEICYILASCGLSIRALVRNTSDSAWAERLKNFGASLALGDLSDPDFLADACVGINEVICSPIALPSKRRGEPSLRNIDLPGMLNLIDATKNSDVLRFVYISFLNHLDLSFPARKGKQVVEQRLIESGIPYTILHAGRCKPRAHAADTQPANPVSTRDLARLAIHALVTPEQSNTIIELGERQDVKTSVIAITARSV